MRLVTVGCSLTYGQWLQDNSIYKPNDPGAVGHKHRPHRDYVDSGYPSKFAWPSVLSNLIGCELSNIAKPGSSNKEIWYSIVNHNWQEGDVLVTLWSHVDRWVVFTDRNDYSKNLRIHPTKLDKDYGKAYYTFIHEWDDAKIDLVMRYNYVKYFAQKRGLTNFHYSARDLRFPPNAHDMSCINWSDAPVFPDITMKSLREEFPNDRAFDNQHPGKLIHKTFAERVYNQIKDKL